MGRWEGGCRLWLITLCNNSISFLCVGSIRVGYNALFRGWLFNRKRGVGGVYMQCTWRSTRRSFMGGGQSGAEHTSWLKVISSRLGQLLVTYKRGPDLSSSIYLAGADTYYVMFTIFSLTLTKSSLIQKGWSWQNPVDRIPFPPKLEYVHILFRHESILKHKPMPTNRVSIYNWIKWVGKMTFKFVLVMNGCNRVWLRGDAN